MNFKQTAILLLAMIIPAGLFAQKGTMPEKAAMHHEVPGKNKFNTKPAEYKTSPAYKYSGSNIYTVQVNVDDDGLNIIGDAANEPSIAIDPTNPDRMFIGWRQFDNVNSDFRQAGYGYTLDGGQVWTFPGVINPGVFRSDPVLGSDNEGTIYYNSLTVDQNDNFWCDVYRSEAGSTEWDDGTYGYGGDKQWMHIDKTGSVGENNNYSFWTRYWSICYPSFFTRSSNLGASYESCIYVDSEPFWGTLATGPDGELYVGGAGEFNDVVVTRSDNAMTPGSAISWDLSTAVDIDGELVGWTPVNPQGLLGQLWIDTDRSDGPGRGNVYVAASVHRNSNTDPADMMFARGTFSGLSWDAPVRINDDPTMTKYQWMGTMSVAPNGRIDVVWLDNRNDPWNAVASQLFYSYSLDQGTTWSVNEPMSELFDPHLGWPQQEKMGDYFHMISDNGGAHLAWANTLNGEQDVYYSYIIPGSVGVDDNDNDRSFMSLSNYPNPCIDQTTLQYTLGDESTVRLVIYDMYGRQIQEIVNETIPAGTHTMNYRTSDLKDGVYVCRLYVGSKVESVRIVKVSQ